MARLSRAPALWPSLLERPRLVVVPADGRAPLPVIGTAVEVAPAAAVMATHGNDRPVTPGTPREPTQQIGGGGREGRDGFPLNGGPASRHEDACTAIERRRRR